MRISLIILLSISIISLVSCAKKENESSEFELVASKLYIEDDQACFNEHGEVTAKAALYDEEAISKELIDANNSQALSASLLSDWDEERYSFMLEVENAGAYNVYLMCEDNSVNVYFRVGLLKVREIDSVYFDSETLPEGHINSSDKCNACHQLQNGLETVGLPI